jgi:tetratricopeptide (TPR) repeat protein
MTRARFYAGVLLLVPTLLFAQAQGRIKGVVTDTHGKAIPGAKVILTCPEIANFRRELIADAKGGFATLIVDATKPYLFHVEAQGFQPIEQMNKPLIGGQTLELSFALKNVQELQVEVQQKVMEQPGIKQAREGQELLEAGKMEEARAKFAEAVAAKPDIYVAWLALGDIDQKAGKNDEALVAAEKCLAVKPEFPQCLALAMNAAQAKGDKEAYAKYGERYKAANPTDPTLYYNEAVSYLNKGDFAAAKPKLEQALQADPNYADALYQLGVTYSSLGEYSKGKETLEKFLKVAPNHKEAATAQAMLDWVKTQIK